MQIRNLKCWLFHEIHSYIFIQHSFETKLALLKKHNITLKIILKYWLFHEISTLFYTFEKHCSSSLCIRINVNLMQILIKEKIISLILASNKIENFLNFSNAHSERAFDCIETYILSFIFVISSVLQKTSFLTKYNRSHNSCNILWNA